ncbi:MAG TPA: Gfo/Idh/MocA family oxidoreductase [Pirellulales bacterium]|nr:Gfo/Idh/MocA family oxidoreductase [Pirellulales bacterium]
MNDLEELETHGHGDVQPLRAAVLGCGYWGPNLIRNFATCEATRLVAVCDLDRARLDRATAQYPAVKTYQSADDLLRDPDVDAVAVATPAATHATLALAALDAGKHVLVEKPLADSVRGAEEVVRKARQRGLTLMVDHTFVYSPAVRKIKELIDTGELGEIYYVDSVRINLGLFQNDVNVLWDLAPHDISIVDHFFGRLPRSLAATGVSHIGSELEDVAYVNMDFGNSLIATFHVNWLSPVKLRHIIIGGSKRSLVYNDLDPVEPVKIYDRGIMVDSNLDARRGLLVSYRTGDIHSPHLPREEPLQNVVRHFAECVQTARRPVTGGEAGLRVVRMLEAAQRSIKAQGGRITL